LAARAKKWRVESLSQVNQGESRGGRARGVGESARRASDRDKVTDVVKRFAAEHREIEGIDENYYRAFLELTQAQVEKLAVAVMLGHEREVRRLAGGRTDAAAVQRVVRSFLHAISTGLARFDPFGRLVFVSRIGPKPWDVDTDDALERRYAEIAPMIENIVRRTLPWLLSREISQSQLPL
jgi:hypothetical protein